MTDKQKIFCLEYLTDLNATQAAIRAGYSKKTARQIGQENLTKLDILDEIQKQQKVRINRLELKGENVIKQLSDIAFSDITDIVNIVTVENETKLVFTETKELSKSQRAGIANLTIGKDGIKVQLHDKISALDKLAKHLGLYGEHNYQKAETQPERITDFSVLTTPEIKEYRRITRKMRELGNRENSNFS